MSHTGNWSPAKQTLERSRLKDTRDDRFPGWVSILGGRLWVEDDSPKGALARSAEVVGECRRSPECSRRLRVDLEWWVRHGLGAVSMDLVKRAYLCGRVGCHLQFNQDQYRDGWPLFLAAGEEGRFVRIVCRKCGTSWTRTIEAFADMIQEMGTGGPNTSHKRLSATVHRACSVCQAQEWSVGIGRPEKQGVASTDKKISG